jgi:hypothetical protein
MEDTEAGHTESAAQKPEEAPSNPSFDAETFCTASIKLLQSTEPTEVRLHDSLSQFKECGKRCGFCRYLYASFGDEMIQEINAQYKTGKEIYVRARTFELRIGEKNRLVDKARLWVSIFEDIGREGKFLKDRKFVILCNGGM